MYLKYDKRLLLCRSNGSVVLSRLLVQFRIYESQAKNSECPRKRSLVYLSYIVA